ncbi:hypothetical protein D3C85_1381150 [compost metagenome]
MRVSVGVWHSDRCRSVSAGSLPLIPPNGLGYVGDIAAVDNCGNGMRRQPVAVGHSGVVLIELVPRYSCNIGDSTVHPLKWSDGR